MGEPGREAREIRLEARENTLKMEERGLGQMKVQVYSSFASVSSFFVNVSSSSLALWLSVPVFDSELSFSRSRIDGL